MRRLVLSFSLLMACIALRAAEAPTPVVFVHGNGDDATKWTGVIWLFESNGYPKDRLFAIRLTDPAARREDSKPEAFRSSTTDQAAELAGFVARVLIETKSKKVALVGSSRGGLTIRNYLKNAGGAAVVSHAVLCGTPNHGVFAMDNMADQEFNAKGNFLRSLNSGSEVVDGVHLLTIRSDKMDKYAQPNVGYDSPALAGAENVVLEGLDHREVAFHPRAFAVMYRFLTGSVAQRLEPLVEEAPVVGGLVTGFGNGAPTNRPSADVSFRVFALKDGSAERDGAAVLEVRTDASGAWGPLQVKPRRTYEFVLEKDGRTVTYFLSGLVRSTSLLNFRLVPPAGQGLQIVRPQGYLARGRDLVMVNGVEVADIPAGVPTRDSVAVKAEGPVKVELRREVVHARPAARAEDTAIVAFLWD